MKDYLVSQGISPGDADMLVQDIAGDFSGQVNVDVTEVRADGTFVASDGETGTWRAEGSSLVLSGGAGAAPVTTLTYAIAGSRLTISLPIAQVRALIMPQTPEDILLLDVVFKDLQALEFYFVRTE